MALLEAKCLQKIYTTRFGGNQVQALSNVSFSVEQGEYVAIMGESGSGKTTLLNILAALDKPTNGEVILEGKSLSSVKEKEISAFRRDNLGFVFQDFNLLDTFTLKDNIFLPLVLSGKGYKEMSAAFSPSQKSWELQTCWPNIPMRFPADKSRGRQLPVHSSQIPNLCLQMSRQARWIQNPQMICLKYSMTLTATDRPF